MSSIHHRASLLLTANGIHSGIRRPTTVISQLPGGFPNSSSRSVRHDPPQPPQLQQQQQPWLRMPRFRSKQPHESSCGSVLICIWNIPAKVKRREFNFLMARVPGVERWDFVSRGPSQESAGYAYCECPTMEDADETMWLIRSFRVANTKLRANLFDPGRVDWSFSPRKIRASRDKRDKEREKLETYREIDAPKIKPLPPPPEKTKRKNTRPVADHQGGKKRPPVRTRRFVRERPPSRRLLLGHAPPATAVGDGGGETCQ